MKRFGKYRRKVSWIVKRYEKYGRNPSWIVKWYEKYGTKPSWIVIRFGKYRRKLWNDRENMEETQVEEWKVEKKKLWKDIWRYIEKNMKEK